MPGPVLSTFCTSSRLILSTLKLLFSYCTNGETEARGEEVTAQVAQPVRRGAGTQSQACRTANPNSAVRKSLWLSEETSCLGITSYVKLRSSSHWAAAWRLGSTQNTVAIIIIIPRMVVAGQSRIPASLPPCLPPHPALWGTDRTHDLESHLHSPQPS